MERPRKGIAVVLGALILASSSLSGALLATSTASASAPQRSKPVVSRSAVRARMREDLRRVRPDGHGGLRPLGGRSGTAAPGHDSRIATNRVRGNVASLRNSSDQTVPTANWSGVLQTTSTKSKNYTSVGGTWTVPIPRPSENLKLSSTWLGIGGTTALTPTVTPFQTFPFVQAGVVTETLTGLSGCFAWYEDYPTPPQYITPDTATPAPTPPITPRPYQVTCGDKMQVSVRNVGTTKWHYDIKDVTKSWTYQHTVTATTSEKSVEWITERPALQTPITASKFSFATIADYRLAPFSHLKLGKTGAAAASSSSTAGAYTYTTMYDTLCPAVTKTHPTFCATTTDAISIAGTVSATTSVSFTDYFTVTRTFGQTVDGTAFSELERQFPSGGGPVYPTGGFTCPGTTTTTRPVVLATDATFPDALASAYLAYYLRTGTLLTPTKSLSATTTAAIRDEGITHVFIVGGKFAVSTTIENKLKKTAAYACGGKVPLGTDIHVTRIAGTTRFQTAQRIALYPTFTATAAGSVGTVDLAGAYSGVNGSGGDGVYNATGGKASPGPEAAGTLPTAILATGATFHDAEAASTLAYAKQLPVLLTTGSTLSAAAATAIQRLGIKQVIIMGGQFAMSNALVTELEHLTTHPSVLRIAGIDFTDTAVELAKCELSSVTGHVGLNWPERGSVTVARGDFYSDGLAGAVDAAGGPTSTTPEPLLLTENTHTAGPYLSAFLKTLGSGKIDGKVVTQMTVLGGKYAVFPKTVNAMLGDLGV